MELQGGIKEKSEEARWSLAFSRKGEKLWRRTPRDGMKGKLKKKKSAPGSVLETVNFHLTVPYIGKARRKTKLTQDHASIPFPLTR